jgi:WD40 repeat protein
MNVQARALVASLVVLLGTCISTRAAEDEPRALFVMNPDGSGVRKVLSIEGFKWLGWARWAHDGKRLALEGHGTSTSRVIVVNADGTQSRDLGEGGAPDWSPDDKQLAFHVMGATRPGVYVQNSDGQGRGWLARGNSPRWSPDGSRLALVLPLRILDILDNSDVNVFETEERLTVFGFDWSPDGKRLAVVADRGTGLELLITKAEALTKDFTSRVRANLGGTLSWSPDGKTLAVSIYDESLKADRIHLVSVDAADPPQVIPGQQGVNVAPAWSPDGKLLAFASSRTDIAAPAVAASRRSAKLELVQSHDKGGTVYSIGISPDGRRAFLGGDMTHRGMQVWDLVADEVVRTFNVPGIFVAVAPDGKRAACAEFIGGDVQLLDLDDGSLVRELKHGAQVISLQFSGDGSRLVAAGADKNVCVFDVASGDELARIGFEQELKQVAFSPDGKLIASTCSDKKLAIWQARDGKKVREIEHPAIPWAVAFSPDGRAVMTGTGGVRVGKPSDLEVQPDTDNAIRIWDLETGKLLREMQGHTHTISSLAYSPDGWVTKAIFSHDGVLALAAGGAEKKLVPRKWFEYPDERVRLFRIVAEGQSPSKGR